MNLQKYSCSNIFAIREVSYRFKTTLKAISMAVYLSFFPILFPPPFLHFSLFPYPLPPSLLNLFLSFFFLDCFSILVLLLSFCKTQIVIQPRLAPNLGPSSPTGFGMFKYVQPHLTQCLFPQIYQNTSISDLDTCSKGQKAVSETMREKKKLKGNWEDFLEHVFR